MADEKIDSLTVLLVAAEKDRLAVLDQVERASDPDLRGLLGEVHQVYERLNEAIRLLRDEMADLRQSHSPLAANLDSLHRRVATCEADAAQLRLHQPIPPQSGPITPAVAELKAPSSPPKRGKKNKTPAPAITQSAAPADVSQPPATETAA